MDFLWLVPEWLLKPAANAIERCAAPVLAQDVLAAQLGQQAHACPARGNCTVHIYTCK